MLGDWNGVARKPQLSGIEALGQKCFLVAVDEKPGRYVVYR
jgi:hypothetical protein